MPVHKLYMSYLTNTQPTTGDEKFVYCLGDSITVGYSNQFLVSPNYQLWPGGYRWNLQRIALAENKRITMVGARTENSTSMSNPWHEGVAGEVITQIQARGTSGTVQNTPDVVLLHAGTNDFYQYVLAGTPAINAIQTRYTALIDAIFARWTNTKIICSTLGHWYDITGTADGARFATMDAMAELGTFNTYVAALPGSHAKGSQIKVVSMHTLAQSASNTTGDGLHPKDWGYARMAWAWWSQLKLLV